MSRLRVFLNYAREDGERVRRLYDNLAAAGFEPWMDLSDIRSGGEWLASIRSAVANSDVFLACVSKYSVAKSGVLREEIDAALQLWQKRWWRRLRLIPVRLDATSVPDNLGRLQWFDLQTDDRWRELAVEIRRAQRRPWRRAAPLAAVLVLGAVVAGWWLSQSLPSRWPDGPQRFGVTLWQLRESTAGDDVRIPIRPTRENGLPRETLFTPVRAALDLPLPRGAMVKISIESAQDGYLYIVDQELAPQPGKACVVFPHPLIHAGANKMRAGEMILLPPAGTWLLKSNNPAYRGELLSIVMSPAPLERVPQGGACPELPADQFANWKQRWRSPHQITAAAGLLARAASRAEFEGGGGVKLLTLDDPRPQVILSMPGRSPKSPVLVSFELPVAGAASPAPDAPESATPAARRAK